MCIRDSVYALAQKVVDQITNDSMTDMEKAFAIYRAPISRTATKMHAVIFFLRIALSLNCLLYTSPCSHRCGGNMAYIIFHKDIFCYKKTLTYTHLMCIL